MSEGTEKVGSLRYLPIFPLPLVLVPGEALPLHIFEPRYRQMLSDIKAHRNLFGISYLSEDAVGLERPRNGSVGCVAEVREVQPLEDGRSNILTNGIIRYRILEYEELGEPYLTARVEFFEDDPEPEETISGLADEVYSLFERVAKAAFDLSENRGRFPEIQRSDPERLSFVVTAAFNLENEVKYEFIEMTNTFSRLKELKKILAPAVKKMESSAEIHRLARSNGHSKTKIDL
jgi:Lon protease-like protein